MAQRPRGHGLTADLQRKVSRDLNSRKKKKKKINTTLFRGAQRVVTETTISPA